MQHNDDFGSQKPDRDVSVTLEYEAGASSGELAKKYSVSRERICQILRRSNAIAHKRERHAAAKEALAAEIAEIKKAAKDERDARIDRAIQIVRNGFSKGHAAREVGLTIHETNLLRARCRQLKIPCLFGKWRDFSGKGARVRELRGQQMTWKEINKICMSENLGKVTSEWVQRNLPDLIKSQRPRTAKVNTEFPQEMGSADIHASGPVEPTERIPTSRMSGWDDEATILLRSLWLQGKSVQECAERLGPSFTRNAILGKINRLRRNGLLSVNGVAHV